MLPEDESRLTQWVNGLSSLGRFEVVTVIEGKEWILKTIDPCDDRINIAKITYNECLPFDKRFTLKSVD